MEASPQLERVRSWPRVLRFRDHKSAVRTRTGAARDALAAAGLSVSLACLSLACAHPAPREVRTPQAARYSRGIRVPIRAAEDVVGHYVGHYEGMPRWQHPVDIYVDAADLCMRARDSEVYRIAIREDGTLAVPGHFGAGLTRQGTRIFLSVSWAYAYGVYERTASEQAASGGSCHNNLAPEN